MLDSFIRKIGVFALLIGLTSCALFESSSDKSDPTVATVDGNPITLSELKANFHNSPATMTPEEDDGLALKEFLSLYIDYKVKLAAGRDAGYFDSEDILRELANYENQSAVPYWLEKRVRDELLAELYERSKYEIKASHILIQLSENASPRDTARAYNRLIEAKQRFLDGEDFIKLSEEYSSRQRNQSMGGELNYFSAGWSVKPFEDVAYNTPVGEVSMPFRTQFGYHIVYVQDRRETLKDRMVSHIFFNTRGEDQSVEESMERAQEAFALLEEGMGWDDVTQNYSDDRQSSQTGGSIGWINTSRYSADFTDAVFSLETVGQYAEPVVTEYGIHILRLDSIRTFASREAEMEHLYERLRQLPRYRQNQDAVLGTVKQVGNGRIVRASVEALENFLDATPQHDFNNQNWDEADELLSMPFYTINDVTYTVSDFKDWLLVQLETENGNRYRFQHLDRFADHAAREQLVSITKQEFEEFAQLSRDYLNGLVVFSITEDSVWNYAGLDTLALKALYEENPEEYWFEQRYRYVRIAAMADSTLLKVKDAVLEGMPIDSLRNEFQGLIIRRDIINSLSSFPFSEMDGLAVGEFSDIFEYRRRQTMYLMEEILEPRQMTFEEAFNKLVATYQPIREAEWMERMRAKYSVHSYPERIR